ncbi:MAG: DUF92 domain-containing protein [Chloroflexota bacterium]
MQLLIGLIVASVISVVAWRFKTLTGDGALAAVMVGGLVFGLGGVPWAVILLLFFFSSSLLSRLATPTKEKLRDKFAKGGRRDWGQVLANGGLGAILAVVYRLSPQPIEVWVAFAGAMAAVTADTWATEIGVLSKRKPRLITTGRVVDKGTSGGITGLGTFSALVGSAMVGLVASLWGLMPEVSTLFIIATLGGLTGAMVDSWLGAKYQGIYYCPACMKETERFPRHICGVDTLYVRGWRWLNNDWVNGLSSLAGALTALVLWSLR